MNQCLFSSDISRQLLSLIGEVGAWIAVGITYETRAHGQYACSLLIIDTMYY